MQCTSSCSNQAHHGGLAAAAAEREQNRTHREPLGGGEYAAPAGAVEQPAAAAPQGTPVGSLPYSPSQGTPLEARLPSQGHDHPSATDSDDSASGDEEPVPAAAGEIEVCIVCRADVLGAAMAA